MEAAGAGEYSGLRVARTVYVSPTSRGSNRVQYCTAADGGVRTLAGDDASTATHTYDSVA